MSTLGLMSGGAGSVAHVGIIVWMVIAIGVGLSMLWEGRKK